MMRSGTRLRSQVCTTEVVVVRAPAEPVELTCGGYPLIAHNGTPRDDAKPAEGLDGGTQIGKRYTDESSSFELLVTKAGTGSLAAGTTPLVVKTAKPLPSSD